MLFFRSHWSHTPRCFSKGSLFSVLWTATGSTETVWQQQPRAAWPVTPWAHLSSVSWPADFGWWKTSLDLCSFFPSDIPGSFSALLISLPTCQGLSTHLWAHCFSSRGWEQLAGLGRVCWPEKSPRSHSCALPPVLFGFISACLEKLHCSEEHDVVRWPSSTCSPWRRSPDWHSDEQRSPTLHHDHSRYVHFKWTRLGSDKECVCPGKICGSEAMLCNTP